MWREFGYKPIAHATVRSYVGQTVQSLEDVRSYDAVHHPSDYSLSQAYALQQRQAGASGILYRSVRAAGGECVAFLKPPATSPVKQAAHYSVNWDGDRFTGYQKLGKYQPLPATT